MTNFSDFTPEQARQLLESWRMRLFHLEQRRARLGVDAEPEVYAEIEKIRDKEIPQLIKQLEPDSREKVSNETSKKIDRVGKRIEQLATEHSGIGFINRKEEFRDITSALARQYIIVEAPFGYGKTFLLDQVETKLDGAGWLVCRVNFKDKPDAAKDEIAFLKAVFDDLSQHATSLRPLPSQPRKILDSVIGRIRRLNRPVALLFDSAEQIGNPQFAHWIRDEFIYKIGQSSDTLKYRCIVAGRYIARTWEQPVHKHSLGDAQHFGTPIRLSPFSFKVIRDTIKRMDAQQVEPAREGDGKSSLTRKEMNDVAQGVQIVSGGHPKCLVTLLLEIEAEFDLGPSLSYFINNLEQLFIDHVETTCKAVLKDIPASVVDIFPYLCLFRCYDNQIVRRVLQYVDGQGKLGKNSHHDEIEILRLVLQHGLVVWQDGLYMDDVVRRIMSLRLRLNNLELARNLNKVALQLYDGWLKTPPRPDISFYQTVLVEYLYHLSMQINLTPTAPDKATQVFQKALVQNLGRFEDHYKQQVGQLEWQIRLENLLVCLQSDDDIRAEMTRATGEYSPGELFKPLWNAVRNGN